MKHVPHRIAMTAMTTTTKEVKKGELPFIRRGLRKYNRNTLCCNTYTLFFRMLFFLHLFCIIVLLFYIRNSFHRVRKNVFFSHSPLAFCFLFLFFFYHSNPPPLFTPNFVQFSIFTFEMKWLANVVIKNSCTKFSFIN